MKRFVKDSRWSWRLLALISVGVFWIIETISSGFWLRSILEKRLRWINTGGVKAVQIAQAPWYYWTKSRHAAERIRTLEAEYSQSLSQLSELSALQQENEELRKIIENSDRRSTRTVVSQPIISYGTPFLGSGSEDGLEPGNLVFVAQTLVGRVVRVSPFQAEVELLTQKGAPSLLAKTEAGVEGVLKADYKALWLTELPSETQIEIGQRVSTTGQVGVPGDLLIGKISALDHNPAAPVQRAKVEQVVSFYEAKVVEVIIR